MERAGFAGWLVGWSAKDMPGHGVSGVEVAIFFDEVVLMALISLLLSHRCPPPGAVCRLW